MPQTIPLLDGHQANFATLKRASKNGDLALLSAVRKLDGANVALVCAMGRNDAGFIRPAPLAVMVEGNPYELFEDPTSAETEKPLGIGSRIWIFDVNTRVYPQKDGQSFGAPIWRSHWVEWFIVGETKVSWLISRIKADIPDDRTPKVPKKGATDRVVCSEAELDELAWVHDNHRRIGENLRRLRPSQLRAIDALLNEAPDKPNEKLSHV